MQNFEFYNPTKVFFGKDTEKNVGEIIKNYGFKKILLHYGKSSIKHNGLYDTVVNSLKSNGVEFAELAGVEPNPKIDLVHEGVELCKKENVEMILAVGGGSVIDSAKVISLGAKVDFDPWEFMLREETPVSALPVATILTLAASGSEMSGSAVISNTEVFEKRGLGSPLLRPLFSIMNPELTYSVSRFQTGCGIVDILMHTLERYFVKADPVDITDRLAEGVIKAVIPAGTAAIKNPNDYEARATLMWGGSVSHNDTTGAGKPFFLLCHQIEHELSGYYDSVAHGAGLSIIFPAWAKYVYKHNLPRFCQFATRIWGIDMDFEHPEKTALLGIEALENYFKSIDMPVRLSELNITDEKFEQMAKRCSQNGERILPSFIPIGEKEIIDILNLCK